MVGIRRLAAVEGTAPRASVLDTLRVGTQVMLPLVARGVIVRRPRVVALAERLDTDRRAVRRLQQLRSRYGPGPLLLRVPARPVALVLSPDHVHRVLDESPEPFAVASLEKRAALSHFQPHGLLISQGGPRADRRRFNEAVLDTGRPVHGMAEALVAKVREETGAFLDAAERSGQLVWDDFAIGWWRMVRRVVLGDAARDDHEVTDLLASLRSDANWAFARPKRRGLRQRFERRVRAYIERAEPGSLASLVASTPGTPRTVPHQQVPQWLFAFDAAGMATFRALALIDAHPEQAHQVRDELAGRDLSTPQDLPYLRACVLESLRLWPTTPAVLRDTTTETTWDSGTMPAGTGVIIFAPFFHRDDQRLPYADRFSPELWLNERTSEDWPLIPFSAGPAECAGRNLVLLLTSSMLATMLDGHEFRLQPRNRLDARRRMPGMLTPFSLRFEVAPTT